MELLHALRKRQSIRGFKQEPVPRQILEEILEISYRAPSAMNTQPWEFTVLAGEVLEKIKKDNIQELRAERESKPEHTAAGWSKESIYRKRQVNLAKQIFKLMEIPREDLEKRRAWTERGFRFFDAPAAIIICTDKELPEAGPLLDIGAVMQNICLASLYYGLGTCIEDQGVMFPQVIRRHTQIPEEKRIIISIAIGYPDWDFPANKLATPREEIENLTTWVGFES